MRNPILRNWRLISFENGPESSLFLGEVTGHPLLNDGWIITSPVRWISDDRSCARTVSRLYELGDEFPRDQSMPEKPRNILWTRLVISADVITAIQLDLLMELADRLCGPLPLQH